MILDMMKQLADESGQLTAFTFLDNGENRELTFGQIYKGASVLATELIRRGLKEGDRVLILADQSAENVIAAAGSMLAKGVFVIIPAPSDEGKKKRLTSVIESCKPRFCLAGQEVCKQLGTDALQMMLGQTVCLVEVEKKVQTGNEAEIQEFDLRRENDQLVYIQYTSGSTSEPKGIMVDYGNLMSALEDSGASIPTEKARTGLSWIPFYHNIGLLCVIFRTFYNQTHFYIMKPESFLQNPMSWFVNCAKYKVQFTAGPNSAFSLCAHYMTDELASQMDLSSLRYILNGSEPVHSKTLEEFVKVFQKTGITMDCMCPAYGLAEVVCGITTTCEGATITDIDLEGYKDNKFIPAKPGQKSKKMVSQGTIFHNTQVLIVNPQTLMPCKEDEIGEIWVTGTSVTRGYWGVSEKEDTAFHQHVKGDSKEYLRTGDYGIIYGGELYVTGRMKEVMIINGHNIYPSDIENDLLQHFPSLEGCTFVIFQIQVQGKERMVVCLEGTLSKEACKTLCGEIRNVVQTSFDASPYDIVFCKPYSFPRTDNGKVKKALVKEYYVNGTLQNYHSAMENDTETGLSMELDHVEGKVKKIIEELLQTSVTSREDDFLDLGGNSFDSVELAQSLNKEFSIQVNMSEILNNSKFEQLVTLVRHHLRQDQVAAKEDNLYEDCALSEDIVLSGSYEKELSQCQTLFLTGATGFLGAYLIRSFMEGTDVAMFCHVRAENEEAGKKRIQKNMNKYGLWKDAYEDRIEAVPGDLKKPQLGMSDDWYQKVAEEADMILHNGALLNFLYPYSYLKETNVKSTEACIRLACVHHPKYIGYVSTFSVYDNPSHFYRHVMEDDRLEHADGYLLPYSETKWVSEKLLELGREKGLRTIVFRPGEITGSSATGKWNFGDMISRSIVSSLKSGEMPTPVSNLYMTPVDFVADAVVCIARQDQAWNHAYNLINLNILRGNELGAIAGKLGYTTRLVSYAEWKRYLFQTDMENSPLKIMEPLFLEDESKDTSIIRRYSVAEPTFDTANADKILRAHNISCPPVSEELVIKYIRNFIAQGVLK